ncbi:hypothetical protein SK128_000853, partial [Halocaridina rubra]
PNLSNIPKGKNMVRPYQDGKVTRSMVRVPGSGTDEGGDVAPICLNLGIVSSLAGMIPVPQTLVVAGRQGHVKKLKFSGSMGPSFVPSSGGMIPEGVTTKLASDIPQGLFLGGEDSGSNVPNINVNSAVDFTTSDGLNLTDNGVLLWQVASRGLGVVPSESPASASLRNARVAMRMTSGTLGVVPSVSPSSTWSGSSSVTSSGNARADMRMTSGTLGVVPSVSPSSTWSGSSSSMTSSGNARADMRMTSGTLGVVPSVSPSSTWSGASSSMTSSGNASFAISSPGVGVQRGIKRPRSVGTPQDSENHEANKRARMTTSLTSSSERNNVIAHSQTGNIRNWNSYAPFLVPVRVQEIPKSQNSTIQEQSPHQRTRGTENTTSVPRSSGGMNLNVPYLMIPVSSASHVAPEGFQRRMHQFLEERDRLRKENAALKYRLACFQQLFRNKDKLRTVLQRMNVACA